MLGCACSFHACLQVGGDRLIACASNTACTRPFPGCAQVHGHVRGCRCRCGVFSWVCVYMHQPCAPGYPTSIHLMCGLSGWWMQVLLGSICVWIQGQRMWAHWWCMEDIHDHTESAPVQVHRYTQLHGCMHMCMGLGVCTDLHVCVWGSTVRVFEYAWCMQASRSISLCKPTHRVRPAFSHGARPQVVQQCVCTSHMYATPVLCVCTAVASVQCMVSQVSREHMRGCGCIHKRMHTYVHPVRMH